MFHRPRLRHQPSTRHRGGWNCAVRPALAGTHAVMLTSNDRWPIFTPTQAAIGNAPCELRLSMCLPTRLELRRYAAPRDGESTSFTSNGHWPTSRPGRLRPGAQPSLFTRAKCEPRTPFQVISSPTVGAFTSGLTHVREPPSWRRHLGCDVIATFTTDMSLNYISGSGIDM
jgi:hypothetical protein